MLSWGGVGCLTLLPDFASGPYGHTYNEVRSSCLDSIDTIAHILHSRIIP